MAQGMQVYGPGNVLWLTVGTKVFKRLGSFTTVFDKSAATQIFNNTRYQYRYTDANMAGKSILLIPRTIDFLTTGKNWKQVWPYKIYVDGTDIIWEYVTHSDNEHIIDSYTGAGAIIAKITWDYGWY